MNSVSRNMLIGAGLVVLSGCGAASGQTARQGVPAAPPRTAAQSASPYGASVLAASASEDAAAVGARLKAVQARYDRLRRSGVDVSSLAPIVREIRQAKDRQDVAALSALLDQASARLDALEAPAAQDAGRATVTAPPAAPASAAVSPGDVPAGSADSENGLVQAASASPDVGKLLSLRAAKVSADGAVGRNIDKLIAVAFQRDVLWNLMRSLYDKDQEGVDASVRAMEYAFRQLSDEGYFKNGLGASPLKAIESDTFFMQSFARVYLMIKNSPFAAQYLPRLEALKPQVARSMAWLAANQAEVRRQGSKAPNRLLFASIAYYGNGVILADPKLKQIGLSLAKDAIATQRADGTFDEHGGYDSSYQATSIGLLSVLLTVVQESDVRREIYEAMKQGAAWELTRIKADGEIEVEGNARTGLGQEVFMGRVKDVNYPEVGVALVYAGAVLDDPKMRNAGVSVIRHVIQKWGG